MKTITRKAAVAIIEAQKDAGLFFSVEFIKRSTGELRKMVCRGGVAKHLKGGELNYDRAEKALIGVWDATVTDPTKAYRNISIEGIQMLKANKMEYLVK